MHRQILIRPKGAGYGGKVLPHTASELVTLYSAEELSRLAIGLPVDRADALHVDLLAFHDRHATPERMGSVVLRRCLQSAGLVS